MKLFWLGFVIGVFIGVFILWLITKSKPMHANDAGTITCSDDGRLVFKFSKPFGWLVTQNNVIFMIEKGLKDAVKNDAEK